MAFNPFSKIISAANEMMIAMSNGLNKNFYNYNELETAMDNYTIVSKDGSLLTVVSVDGIRDIISGQTYISRVISGIAGNLSTILEKQGHVIQSCFHYNPTKAEMLLDKMLEPSYETCKRLNLDLEYMLDAKKEVSKQSASEEKNFLLIWTTTAILNKQEAKTAFENRAKEFQESGMPKNSNASNPFAAVESVYNRHISVVDSIVRQFLDVGVVVKKLTAIEAIRQIRMGVDEEYTSENWKPFLPGDRMLPVQMKQYQNYEEWDIIAPKLSQQICNKDAEIISNKIVKVGNVYYAPIYIELMPKEIKFFNELFKTIISTNIPWRILYTLSGDGMASIAMRHTISRILHFSSSSNKLFNKSAQTLKQLVMENGTVVKFQIALVTWADSKERAEENVAQLARVVESWGSCNVSEVTGNPISGLASASMGFTKKGIANVSAAPIEDAVTMLPFSRPSSLWSEGAVILQSPDGKLLPYQPMSPLQETWITLIFAGPGSGKSVFTNMTHIALCLSPGIERLPLISILDIGPSSKGFIELMKDALPSHQKHYALYTRITNDSKYTMNPFDLKVGCRFPFAVDETYLVNLLSLMMTDPGQEKLPEGVSGFVADVVRAAYEYYCDSPTYVKSEPKRYVRLESPEVDNALREIGFDFDIVKANDDNQFEDEEYERIVKTKRVVTWFEIVDLLAKNNRWHEAILAQRFAVPVLSDLTTVVANDTKIQDTYKDLKVNDESVFNTFQRLINNAIQLYPLLSGITKYDLGQARIISLDLDQVAKTGGVQADRQTAIMYMYGMKLISGDFFLDKANLEELPFKPKVAAPHYTDIKIYKDYHIKRINEIREDKKRLSIDEFHRTSKTQMVRDQVIVYMREGRKWGVEVILASQSIQDFDERMLEFATATFVMSAGNNATIAEIVKRLGANDSAEIHVLQNSIKPPSKRGNTFMSKFKTKEGLYTQLQNNKMGPVEIWSLSTTVDDVKIRDLIFEEVGNTIGRKMLAEMFPDGTATSEVDNRKRHMDEASALGVHKQIVDEVIYRLGPKYGIQRKERYMAL